MSANKSAIKKIKIMLGAELRRVREEKGLSLEEAARAVGIERVNILRQLEEGQGAKVFFIFKLLELYRKRVTVKLVDC